MWCFTTPVIRGEYRWTITNNTGFVAQALLPVHLKNLIRALSSPCPALLSIDM